jgi:sigma-B regulation protein RsbU (phosphoserine phosphatase)
VSEPETSIPLDYWKIQLFKDIPASHMAQVMSVARHVYLQHGEQLIEAGQENHHLFLLLDGALEAHLTHDHSHAGMPIAVGEAIGEMSILDGQKTSANVYSVGESVVWAIHENDFWRLIAPLPGVMRNLTRLIIQRLRQSSEAVARAFEEQLKFEHLKRELATAHDIQMGLLPHHNPLLPLHRQAEVFAYLLPAKEVGGDLYDAFAIDDEHILLAVGDVSGKGMPAAMFMMRTLTLLRAHGKAKAPCDQLMPTLNRLLCEGNEANMFVTLYVVVFSVVSGRMVLFNGGHPPPLLSRQGGAFEPVVGAKGALLGMLPSVRFVCHELTLAAGDRLVLYSDGVTEAENPSCEMFSQHRAQALLDAQPKTAAMAEMVTNLAAGVKDFAGDAVQSDDITVLALRYLGGALSNRT